MLGMIVACYLTAAGNSQINIGKVLASGKTICYNGGTNCTNAIMVEFKDITEVQTVPENDCIYLKGEKNEKT
jgi:hypothetical protein